MKWHLSVGAALLAIFCLVVAGQPKRSHAVRLTAEECASAYGGQVVSQPDPVKKNNNGTGCCKELYGLCNQPSPKCTSTICMPDVDGFIKCPRGYQYLDKILFWSEAQCTFLDGKDDYANPVNVFCFEKTSCEQWDMNNPTAQTCGLSANGNYYCRTTGPPADDDMHAETVIRGAVCTDDPPPP